MANLFRKIIVSNCQQIRYFPRWGHRRPAGVIMPDEYDQATDSVLKKKEFLKHEKNTENVSETQRYPKIKWRQPTKDKISKEFNTFSEKHSSEAQHGKVNKPLTITKKIKQNAPKVKTVDMLETIIDAEGNFIYSKMGNNDIRISKIMADLRSKKVKEKKELMLLEGKMLIKEALEARCKLEYILFSRMNEIEYLKPYLPKTGANLYKMPYREIQIWSDLVTTPGIMGIFKIPGTESFETQQPLPLTIICDNVREPNNLGAILRVSSGVGCENLILSKGCVDVWETKVLRTACGAHFKLHISKKSSWDEIKTHIPENAHIFIADNNTVISDASEDQLQNLVANVPVLPYYSVNFKLSKHIVLIIGGETEGISEESYNLAKEFNGLRLNIPLSNGLDSLNTGTALGIIAFEIKRQLSILKQETLEDYKVRNISLNT